MKDFTIRSMIRGEIDLAVEWAAQEGWNPGLNDADCYHAADPDGFLVGLLDGEAIGCISAVRYSDDFGFLGFYIVKPEYRGQGYGIRLWQAAMSYLNGCNIGLDGVVDQQANYKKSGFRLACRNVRFEGWGGGGTINYPDIVSLSALPFDQISNYNKPLFPAERKEFLKLWINQPGSCAAGILDNGNLAGYGVIRRCRAGYKIGPLFADSPELADKLFCELSGGVSAGAPVYLDVPETNPEAVALARRHDMKVSFETARMYNREIPDLRSGRTFGVTSFEVG